MRKNTFFLINILIVLFIISFLFLTVSSQTINVKDYIKDKFPSIFGLYLSSLEDLDLYEKEFIDLLQKLPKEEQEYYAKEVYKNGFFLELLKSIKEGKKIKVPTSNTVLPSLPKQKEESTEKRNVMKYIIFILSDKVIFPVFEISFFLLFFYAFLREKGFFINKSGVKLSVKRGKESWNNFYLTFGIASIILIQVINSSNSLRDYKTIISIINLIVLVYLTFFNGWFRNKIIAFISNSQNKVEKT